MEDILLSPFLLAGGLLYTGLSISYRERKKNSNEDLLVAVVGKVDTICQQFAQQNLDPLLSRSTRQTQLTQIGDGDAPSVASEQEQELNRLVALSGVMIVSATISTYLFSPLLILTTALGIYLLLPLYKRTFKTLIQEHKIRLNLLISLYLTASWLAGYYIFAGIALGLFFLGLKVVYHMEGHSRKNLSHLLGQQPRFVWQRAKGVDTKIPLSELQVGDVVVVNAGEPLPVDGIVIKGFGLVDQHMLTGESQPVEKEVDDRVFASTLLLKGPLYIQVEKTGENTVSANIVAILNKTAHHQTEVELKGQKLADQTALPNLLISLVALPLVGLAGAVAILGVGIGSNMRFFSILATVNYLAIASRHHILVKDARALERLKAVDTVVFDKTGTLTLEQPHVAKIHAIEASLSKMDLLTYAATAEFHQPHPIAKAIISAAEERGLSLPRIDEARYEVGYGISVWVKEKLIRVGSRRFLTRQGLTIPAQIETLETDCQVQGIALVWVAVDERVVGALELHATVRPEAKRVIHDLQQRNVSVAIISGDQKEPTRTLASELGIERYFANTLPEDKAKLVKQLQKEGRVVCFIGDGINDAIALKQADVSISLQGASSLAIDTAQIVLMDQSLNRLDYLLTLAHKYDDTLRTGFTITIVPGVICIAGVFLAGFGLYTAEILFQLGFFGGLALAMRPLLIEKRTLKD